MTATSTPPPTPALEAVGLRKRYGRTIALDGFDLIIGAGTVHGLLGPNGAGKTTAVRCLTTLTSFDEGTAAIAGTDVRRHPAAVRERIGLVGHFHAVDDALTARQNLMLFARLSGLSKRRASGRIEELLAAFSLTDAADRAASGFSGGMRRRLDSPRRSCSSTSPPADSTRVAGPRCGRPCAKSPPPAPPCCSRRSTSTRPISSPTGYP